MLTRYLIHTHRHSAIEGVNTEDPPETETKPWDAYGGILMSSRGFPKSMTTYSYMVCMAKANEAVSRMLTEGTSVTITNGVIVRWHVQQERDLCSINVSLRSRFKLSRVDELTNDLMYTESRWLFL